MAEPAGASVSQSSNTESPVERAAVNYVAAQHALALASRYGAQVVPAVIVTMYREALHELQRAVALHLLAREEEGI